MTAEPLPHPVPAASMLAVWLDRLRDLRNRKVADPGFRRFAARFFLTRPFARRQAAALFDLAAGFVYAQILRACVRAELFDLLAPGPLAPAAIAGRTGLPLDGALRLVRAAASLDLLEERRDGRFALGPLGAAMVGNPGVTAMIAHHDMLYRDLEDPIALLSGRRRAELNRFWSYADRGAPENDGPGGHDDPPSVAGYTALMGASQAMVAAEILDAYPLDRHRRLLDVGGGDASFLVAAGARAPHLALSLFELPAVARIAQGRLAAAGLAARATVTAGSFLADPLPTGADLVTLNRILHDHDDAEVLRLLRAVRRAIAPDGVLLVAEPMAGTPGARASGDAYFGFYLLAMGQGRPRTLPEIVALLTQAGFDGATVHPTHTPMIARLVSARPTTAR
ncbi:methyltransferase [Aureimonas glaciei]|uniref:O-methyltransferase n=1 Tax=Aureimonas glaciei TaxID=1776957 RepID=A0A916XWM1_9HYPH|nr:methyltransferase [Aureimonas glaciei]GGD17197.1 O-methyltransferase [Aureimonas glaciei]